MLLVPYKQRIITFAPNTAAFETPSVAGEAIGFFNEVCIKSPERESPPPMRNAARFLGRIILCIIRFAATSLLPNKPKKQRSIDMFVGVIKKERQKRRMLTPSKIKRVLKTFFLLVSNGDGISLLCISIVVV